MYSDSNPPALSQAYHPQSQQYSAPQGSYGYGPQGPPPYFHHQGYNTYPPHSSAPTQAPQTSFKTVAHEYIANQQVKVHVTANVWVVGVVIAVLDVANKFFGPSCSYRVEYTSPGSDRPIRRDFPPAELRPLGPQ